MKVSVNLFLLGTVGHLNCSFVKSVGPLPVCVQKILMPGDVWALTLELTDVQQLLHNCGFTNIKYVISLFCVGLIQIKLFLILLVQCSMVKPRRH